jgi:hypothetical protein
MVDVATAKHHGVCPTCEGYGGALEDPEECQVDGHHPMHSCIKCWCPGCHDGLVADVTAEGTTYVAMEIDGIDREELCGSFAAYEFVWGAAA